MTRTHDFVLKGMVERDRLLDYLESLITLIIDNLNRLEMGRAELDIIEGMAERLLYELRKRRDKAGTQGTTTDTQRNNKKEKTTNKTKQLTCSYSLLPYM